MRCGSVGVGVGECVYGMCVMQWSGWLCAGRFYSLCVSPFSLSPLTSLCSASTPFHPQSFEKVGVLFLFFCYSFVSESFTY